MDNSENLATQGAQGTRRQTKQKHYAKYVGHQYTQTNTNDVSKT
jgi:hypothetical protein